MHHNPFTSEDDQFFKNDFCEFSLPAMADNPRIAPMTVAIGAICEKSNAAVVAADRIIINQHLGTRTNGPDCKIKELSPNVAIAASGHPVSQYLVQSFLRKNVTDYTVRKMARAFFNA